MRLSGIAVARGIAGVVARAPRRLPQPSVAGRARRATRGGTGAAHDRPDGSSRFLQRRVRRGPPRDRQWLVHGGGSRHGSSQLGGARDGDGVRPPPVDDPAELAGVSHVGVGVDRRRPPAARRSRRRAVGPLARGGAIAGRPRPYRRAPRTRRRRRPSRAAAPRARRRRHPPRPGEHAAEPGAAGRHHLPLRRRRRRDGVSLIQSNAAGFGSGSSSRRPASTSTTGASASASRPATPPSTGPAAARRTPCRPRSSTRSTAAAGVIGTREATASRRSFCNCWPDCCATASRPRTRWRRRAGCSRGRARDSTRGLAAGPIVSVEEGRAAGMGRGLRTRVTRRRGPCVPLGSATPTSSAGRRAGCVPARPIRGPGSAPWPGGNSAVPSVVRMRVDTNFFGTVPMPDAGDPSIAPTARRFGNDDGDRLLRQHDPLGPDRRRRSGSTRCG